MSWLKSLFGLRKDTDRVADVLIKKCQVRECQNEHRTLLGDLRLCEFHWKRAGYDAEKARRIFTIVSMEELEAQTPNPCPFTKRELPTFEDEDADNFGYCNIMDWEQSAELDCPKCGNIVTVENYELMRDILGEATTTIDGKCLEGVVVLCGTCSSLWRVRATEKVRLSYYASPIGEISYEAVHMVPMSQKEEFPFGCPSCREGKPITITVPTSSVSTGESKGVAIYYSCPLCKTRWTLDYHGAFRLLFWRKRDSEDRTSWHIKDCKSCGSSRSLYAGAVNNLRWHNCRACGLEEHEEID